MGRLISCKEASRLLSQMQEGDVPLLQELRVRLHLLWCEACKHFDQQLHFLRTAMRRYTR
jgi:hypothetical protein